MLELIQIEAWVSGQKLWNEALERERNLSTCIKKIQRRNRVLAETSQRTN